MPKKRSRVPKDGPVWHRAPAQATLDRMPKYNAHACGTGAHGDAKYNRAKQERSWRRELDREARSCGPLPFYSAFANRLSAYDRFRLFSSLVGWKSDRVPNCSCVVPRRIPRLGVSAKKIDVVFDATLGKVFRS